MDDPSPQLRHDFRFLSLATKIAGKSTCDERHSAIVFQGSRVFSTGYNQYKGSVFNDENDYWSTHAEVNALNKIKHHESMGKVNILVVRINKSGKLMFSRPCETCLKTIKKHFNVDKIFYTTSDGMVAMERI